MPRSVTAGVLSVVGIQLELLYSWKGEVCILITSKFTFKDMLCGQEKNITV